MTAAPRVVVVTGGGAGIGAGIAEELGRQGAFVVTMDPLVTLDGTERLPAPEETTAGRIIAAGGSARASPASVTDADAVRDLFTELVREHGRLDAVINVAGITRPSSFASGSEEDWLSVLAVHLDGYRNVLEAALPIMAAAGHGRILGVTSGSGWRSADAGAYSAAKRAVAALTWQVGRVAPPGVVVNAISPIAVTRMVTAALERARAASGGGSGSRSSTGGLSLGSMPEPEHLGPLGAHLVAEDLAWCTGRAIFAGGSEVAVIDQPRLLEVVRTDRVASLAGVLEAVAPAWAGAERDQASGGGSNPRFGTTFDEPPADLPAAAVASCVIVTDQPPLASNVTAALEARGVRCHTVAAGDVVSGFAGAAGALESAAERLGPLEAVVVGLAGRSPDTGGAPGWERVLAEHESIVTELHADAAWTRAAADHAARAARPVRLVTLTDATTSGGRSRAQASAQLSRAARKTTKEQVVAFAVGVEAADEPVGELTAHLLCSPSSPDLSGAELVVARGWFGLRSHPHPSGSISFGGPSLPDWFDDALREIVDAR